MELLHNACISIHPGKEFREWRGKDIFCWLWVSANTHTSLSCVLRAGGSATGPSRGSGPSGKASLQPPRTVQKVWVPRPKPSLTTFIGAQALTGDLKELGVLFKTAGMLIPMGNQSPSLQKENSGFSRQTSSGPSAPEREGGRRCFPVAF